MKARRFLFVLLVFFLSACISGQQDDDNAPIAGDKLTATAAPIATATPTGSPSPTSPPAPTDTATAIPAATSAAPPSDLSITADSLTLYPGPAIYEGDLVSFQIMPYIPPGLPANNVEVQVWVDGALVSSGVLDWRTFSGRPYGMFTWAWPATSGDHTVTAILDPADHIQVGDENPDNNQVNLTVSVQPRSALPQSKADATWLTADNDCCTVHVVSSTAAHRDLEALLPQVDAAFQKAANSLGRPLTRRFDIYLAGRVFGQGGYAADDIVISYLDRDYAGGGLFEVLVHEAVHLLDQPIAPNRITFLAEGIAVWATGGHYQQEDLGQRMVALRELGLYVPLTEVLDSFYDVQHEISYLVAGAFVDYLVTTYGWNQVRAFYGSVTSADGPTQAAAMDARLQLYFGRTLAQVEADWMAYLDNLPRDRFAAENLRTTIRFFETMRRYQSVYDPTAYYLDAWLPVPQTAKQLGATADFVRHPQSPSIIALETMLQSADTALQAGDYPRTNALLDSVVRILDNNGAFLDPLANAYLSIVRATAELGYEAQQITVDGNRATVWASRSERPDLIQLNLALSNQTWVLAR
jgi:hypothetical protein